MPRERHQTRFQARTEVERQFLCLVNSKFGDIAPISGMTGKSIQSWRDRAYEATKNEIVEETANILLEAAKRAQILADDSRDTFKKADRQVLLGTDELKTLLKNLLTSR